MPVVGDQPIGYHQYWLDQSSSYSPGPSDRMPNYHRDSVHSNGYSTDGQPGGGDEAPTYNMEHLATFTVAKETGIVYPADGMRRLLQLEKSNGIWSQKMQLRLDRNWLLIMDYETGAVMERFPVKLIQEPTAFTSHDPMEMYNNILVFIVGDDRSDHVHNRSEMHIFQCQSISAQELVEDLKLLRVGKMPLGRRARPIPPPPATPPPEPPGNGVNVREQVSVFNAANHTMDGRGIAHPGHDGLSLNDETSSTSSDKYERDVTILNHCFDDIEKFIARLQHAAAASRELERRRRNRKSKKKDLGDGMLTMRAKPPPEAEFIDIFQKFKLSFNLLAKLKAHIHDPNAPELVHFLFTPLALIVDASHDTHYGPNLPAKVISPLLTREAVNLLVNCVTSKETELWNSLGDAWLISRDQWKSYVPEYHPVFLDGWSPDYPVSDERERDREHREHSQVVVGQGIIDAKRTQQHRESQHSEVEQHYPREPDREDSHYSSDYFDYEQQETSPTDPHRGYAFDNRNYGQRPDPRYREERARSQSPGGSEGEFHEGTAAGHRDASARSDISADSIERNGGGEGQQRFEHAQSRWLEELRSRGAKVVTVTYPRTANNDKELTVIRGEYLEVVDDSRKWWKARNIRGQVAHVPHTIVTIYQGDGRESSTRSPPAPPPAPGVDWVRKERTDYSSDSDFSSDEDGLPARKTMLIAPPPPPPPPNDDSSSESSTPRQQSTSLSRATSSQDLMQEELRSVLTLFREKRPNLGIVKTPEVYIYQNSNSKEVQHWLREKNFSDRVCKQLHGLTGNELFGLSKKELIDCCGQQEGTRLDSQITVQRNISGYNTVRSTELRNILAKAREKVEEKNDVEHQPKISSVKAAPAERATPKRQSSKPQATSPTYDSDSDDDQKNFDEGGLADMIKKTTLKRTSIPLNKSK